MNPLLSLSEGVRDETGVPPEEPVTKSAWGAGVWPEPVLFPWYSGLSGERAGDCPQELGQ